mmetsp:Transcript_7924/g.17680  ORF Transcript_7924/g.17680 Transcript_7924/m.17680 type:complete len:324 (+) Transcript_7924:270-1241(+)
MARKKAAKTFDDHYSDEIGRCFCTPHDRAFCHVCCVDYRMMNRMSEEDAGLRKKDTPVEAAARMYATALRALRGMERMVPRPSEQVFAENRRWRDEQKAILDKARDDVNNDEDVDGITMAAIDRERSDELDNEAMIQSMSRLNPGQQSFEMGGEESQRIYDEFVKGPQQKENRGDYYTCAYCNKTGTKKLMVCSRCKKVSYCSVECQRKAWPAHRKNECVKADTEAKKLKLTWAQVEAHEGNPAKGTLEVKVIKDESMMRQVFQCKDRIGSCRRIAAYTDSRKIEGLRVGSTLRWKNPRFHYFMDGSSGARIEEEDLEFITVL